MYFTHTHVNMMQTADWLQVHSIPQDSIGINHWSITGLFSVEVISSRCWQIAVPSSWSSCSTALYRVPAMDLYWFHTSLCVPYGFLFWKWNRCGFFTASSRIGHVQQRKCWIGQHHIWPCQTIWVCPKSAYPKLDLLCSGKTQSGASKQVSILETNSLLVKPRGCSGSSLKARGRTCLDLEDLELRTVTTMGSVRPKLVLVVLCSSARQSMLWYIRGHVHDVVCWDNNFSLHYASYCVSFASVFFTISACILACICAQFCTWLT
jgi:hypothetical protein